MDTSLVVHSFTNNIQTNNRNNLTGMYTIINKSIFISDTETKKWSFEQKFIDHYSMMPSHYILLLDEKPQNMHH